MFLERYGKNFWNTYFDYRDAADVAEVREKFITNVKISVDKHLSMCDNKTMMIQIDGVEK